MRPKRGEEEHKDGGCLFRDLGRPIHFLVVNHGSRRELTHWSSTAVHRSEKCRSAVVHCHCGTGNTVTHQFDLERAHLPTLLPFVHCRPCGRSAVSVSRCIGSPHPLSSPLSFAIPTRFRTCSCRLGSQSCPEIRSANIRAKAASRPPPIWKDPTEPERGLHTTEMLLLLIILLLIGWLLMKPFYWKFRGVPSTLPLPFFGNFLPSVYLSNKEFYDSLYYRFPDAPYVGTHMLIRPVLILKDPEMIQEILEEKSHYFASHGFYVNKERDIFAKSLFHIDGADWKSLRAKLSPLFSPAKVKTMMQVGKDSIDRLVDEVESRVGKEIEAHSSAMFLTVDFTASALFGLETPIFKERTESEFYKSARDLNTPLSMHKLALSFISPAIYNFFKLISFTPRANAFILNMIDSSVKCSKRNQGKSKNAMDSLLELMNSDMKWYDDEFLKSQGALLWTGGVETTANTLGFTLYELATNMDIQHELRSKLGTEDGHTLMRNVITETLRKYPVFFILPRRCTQRCKLSTGLELEPGTMIIIPALSIQNDPKLFPSPEEYIPGREMPKGAFLGFGAGPRTCLGMKLAYTVLEEALTKLLQKFEFAPGSIPTEVAPKAFFTTPKNGVWLKVRAL